MSITLVLGGARSGKSRFAQRLALSLSKSPVYLATSRSWDEDHVERIRRHQRERGPEWTSIEEEKQISSVPLAGRVVVVDCVTLWLTNFFMDLKEAADLALDAARAEFLQCDAEKIEWIFVSNELGQGLHATTESGRKFADIQGLLNQEIAQRAERVVLMVAGIPLDVKKKGQIG